MQQYLISQHYRHPLFGEVAIRVCPTSRRFSARWKGQMLTVNIPPRTTLASFQEILDQWTPELLAKRPRTRYTDGQTLTFPDFTILIRTSPRVEPQYINSKHLSTADSSFAIEVGPGVDFSNPSLEKHIAQHIRRIATFMASGTLPALADAEFRRLNITPPPRVTISHGLQRLGFCSPTQRRIALSLAVMFLSDELRRYIICHEIAHLTHPNHSAAFHALVDTYTDGREADLERQLRAFPWPIPR